MALTKEQKKEREAKKRAEWSAELVRLSQKQSETSRTESEARERASKRNNRLLSEAHAMMQGANFRAWYEATTGEDVAEFLDRVIIDHDEYVDRYGHSVSQLEWTQSAIELIVLSNPWSNPETREYWAEQIAFASDSKERRTILLRLATPRWANKEAVTEIYRERERLVAETGIPHDVDHVVPIVHPEVCGLHCEFNLRVIPASENRSKSNLFNGTRKRFSCF